MWFTGEKIFTVTAPSNSQNDCVYAAYDLLKKQIAALAVTQAASTLISWQPIATNPPATSSVS